MLRPGTLFGDRYEVLRCISAGGMGTVYEVIHRETRRRRALKVMLPDMLKDADLRRRFALEAQITADVESEHIVETFDAGVDAATGCPFLVMELLRGEDLGSRLSRLSRMGAREVVGVLQQAARALDRTHAAGIVHRDLKPENLFITQRDDGSLRLKVLDFGIAKVVRQSEVGHATRSMGTPIYMAPEQFEGEPRIGPAVDRYALGHIAYTLLVGEPYWATEARELGSAVALMGRVARGAPEPPSERAARHGMMLPPEIDAWFLRATAVDPADRFDDVREQIVDLADALGVPDAIGAPIFGTVPREATPVGEPPGTPRDDRQRELLGGATTQAEPSGDQGSGHDLGSRTVGGTDPRRRRRATLLAIGAAVVAGAAVTALALREPSPAHEVPAVGTEGSSVPSLASSAAPPAIATPAVAPTAPPTAPPTVAPAVAAPTAEPSTSAATRPPQPTSGRAPPRVAAPPPSTAPRASAPPTAAPEPWRTR